jgi:hypothetical protein
MNPAYEWAASLTDREEVRLDPVCAELACRELVSQARERAPAQPDQAHAQPDQAHAQPDQAHAQADPAEVSQGDPGRVDRDVGRAQSAPDSCDTRAVHRDTAEEEADSR